ncbi:MAG TPA: NYN domain-containing protein [Bryobacteraceae bacterium]|nr:NYN domain-containing protein [Bryobacteraceae bacterium]
MEEKLKLAVFIDFDNIEIGVKSTLHREFDVAAVLDSLKERGEIVTCIAYANWGRQEAATRAMTEHAVQMVQRDPSPRGDKNGADINLALDALEMAFTHDHINAFAIVSGDSDFIALLNKLKQYDKRVFVLGGKAFTSTILQKNCHEFISYESLLDEPKQSAPPQPHRQAHQGGPQPQRSQPPQKRPAPLDLAQAMPLVERALQVLERRGVRPQLGLLKSTMLQLDSAFSEKVYGSSSFTDFVEKLQKSNFVHVTGGEGRYMIKRIGSAGPEKSSVRPEAALPVLRDVLETHRLEVDEGVVADALAEWVRQEHPDYDWKQFGFQEFSELLNYAQDKLVVRINPDEEKGLLVYLGPEFHPPAPPEPAPESAVEEEAEEPQPIVEGQPTAAEILQPAPRRRGTRKTAEPGSEAPPKKRAPRRKKTVEQPNIMQ